MSSITLDDINACIWTLIASSMANTLLILITSVNFSFSLHIPYLTEPIDSLRQSETFYWRASLRHQIPLVPFYIDLIMRYRPQSVFQSALCNRLLIHIRTVAMAPPETSSIFKPIPPRKTVRADPANMSTIRFSPHSLETGTTPEFWGTLVDF